jgi:hypothetical protein
VRQQQQSPAPGFNNGRRAARLDRSVFEWHTAAL